MVERRTEAGEVDYVECKACDSPCYTFQVDPKTGKIVQALCSVCGNDDTSEFVIPEEPEE